MLPLQPLHLKSYRIYILLHSHPLLSRLLPRLPRPLLGLLNPPLILALLLQLRLRNAFEQLAHKPHEIMPS